MSEQSRASEYRRKMIARTKNKVAAERALAGDPERLRALEAKTAPLLIVDNDGVRRGGLLR